MKIVSAVFLGAAAYKKPKPEASCDISQLFEENDFIYKISCPKKDNFSKKNQVLNLYKDKNGKVRKLTCDISCKYDKGATSSTISAKLNKKGVCILNIPDFVKNGMCGKGCSNDSIVALMGPTVTRADCTKGMDNGLAKINNKCLFFCNTQDGQIKNDKWLKCSCSGDEGQPRVCDWVLGKRSITAQKKNGQFYDETLNNNSCDTGLPAGCSEDEHLALASDDYLYVDYMDYIPEDLEYYNAIQQCIPKLCKPIPLDGLTCYDKNGVIIEGTEDLPEGARCGRECTGNDVHDFSPYLGCTGDYNCFDVKHIPAGDAVCTCGHQVNWPTTDDYSYVYGANEYFGNYCEWTYGSGPANDSSRKRRNIGRSSTGTIKERLDSKPGEPVNDGKFAAKYLAQCASCKSDMVNDSVVFNYIKNNLYWTFSDYGTKDENGFQHVEYTVNGEEFEFGFEELWNFRDINCPTEIGGTVKIGESCTITCKDGYMMLPGDSRSDTIKCIGAISQFGTGGWEWMPDPSWWHPGYGAPTLDLRVCVPNNYANRD